MADSKLAITNPPKAFVASLAMVCITALMMAERISPEAATGMLGAIVGYAIGNGIAATQHQKVQPIIGERE
jgi:hypothetical protein